MFRFYSKFIISSLLFVISFTEQILSSGIMGDEECKPLSHHQHGQDNNDVSPEDLILHYLNVVKWAKEVNDTQLQRTAFQQINNVSISQTPANDNAEHTLIFDEQHEEDSNVSSTRSKRERY